MDDQSRLTYLTRHYYDLQGIRTAPTWISLLVFQVTPKSSNGLAWAMVFLTLGLMSLWSWLAQRYYARRFGRVESTWIFLPTSRLYWGLLLGAVAFSMYRVIFTNHYGDLPYIFTLVWMSPLFNSENPLLRRAYYAVAGAVVISLTYYIQFNRIGNKFVIAIQCIVLLALGLADHLLLMSLRTPAHEDAVA
jgi:hypothetical protein